MKKDEETTRDETARYSRGTRKGSGTLKVVYMGGEHHNQWEPKDATPEARKNPVDGSVGQPVAPSSYDRTAVNKTITQEDIDDYPELKDVVAVGDFVDERDFNDFVGKENKDHPQIDPEFDKTDEELNQEGSSK